MAANDAFVVSWKDNKTVILEHSDIRKWLVLLGFYNIAAVTLSLRITDSYVLTLVNGRIGTPLGRARALPSPNLEAALLTLAAVAKRRAERGYDLTPHPSTD